MEPTAAAVTPSAPVPGETEVLRAFLGRLLSEPRTGSWDDFFPTGGHLGARASYFLLHRDPGGGPDAEGFVTATLERILLQLACRTEREHIEYQGRVRGQIVWSATLKSRYTGSYDPTRYVCREVRRRFDTPENQLLRFTMERIWWCLKAVPPVIRSGFCYYPAGGRFEASGIDERLREMEVVLPRLLKHPQLRAVTLPETITPEHILRAQASKLEEYGLVAELYERLRDAVIASSWEGVARLGRQSLPLPDRVSDTTEPWIHLAAAIHQRIR